MLFHPFPVPEFLARAARAFAGRCAIDFLGRHVSFAELKAEADALTAGLQHTLYIQKGERVGLLLPNCPAYVVAYNAILQAGGVVVNINPLYSTEEIAHLLQDAEVKTLITLDLRVCYDKIRSLTKDKLKRVVVVSMARQLPWYKGLMLSLFRSHQVAQIPADDVHTRYGTLLLTGRAPSPIQVMPGDLAVLQYTGGTTGVPKAAMLSHANVSVNAQQCGDWFAAVRPGEHKMLAVLPFFHCFAMTAVMNFSLLKAATMILHPKFNLVKVLEDIERKKPTLMCGVPTMYTALLHAPDLKKYDLSSLKACISGGAPLPLEIKRQFEEITGCTLIEGYGLSEASPVCAANPFDGENREGSIGLPFPDTEVAIEDRDDRGTFFEPKSRKEGEICVRGPQVMQGYLNHPEDTARVLFNGWLRTGDIGFIDKDGYIFVIDRVKEMILSGGYNVYPRRVEEAIYEHPAVAECAVIGIPDSYFGEVPKAFIVVKPDAIIDEDRLIAYLAPKLAKFEVPRSVAIVEALPKTLIGKVDKKKLPR